MFNVIISVPDEWTDYDKVKERCDFYLSNKESSGEKINVLITKQGALSEKYAKEKGYGIIFIPVNWKYGNKAITVQCSQLADLCNASIIFFSSYGTNWAQNTLNNICSQKKVPTRKIEED